MLNGLDQYLAKGTAALDLRVQRSEALASNIANADTPNYKARDFDFAATLRSKINGGKVANAPLALMRTSAQHFASTSGSVGGANLQYRNPAQSSIDGNTVELDAELTRFTDNAVHYQVDLTFVSGQISGLQRAITGQ
ncbi:MAG: flagellar basal body rod protein FlgB [Betaproteobacteria bacterium]